MSRLLPGAPWYHPDMACLSRDPELFFSGFDEHVAEAKRVCAGCPLIEACRERARVTREQFGVWGGETEQERRKVLEQLDEARDTTRGRRRRGRASGSSSGKVA